MKNRISFIEGLHPFIFLFLTVMSIFMPRGFAATPTKIYLDVGHGGKDRGAEGMFNISENDLCLRVGKLVKKDLGLQAAFKRMPVDIRLSRETDVFLALKERAEQANHWGADVFLSIHANSAEKPLAHGFEVYFLSPEATDDEANILAAVENAKEAPLTSGVLSILSDVQTTFHIESSSGFAQTVFRSMAKNLKPNVHGVRQAPFTVLSGTIMPALLVEIGYVNHIEDASHLSNPIYLKRLAHSIGSGIIDFLRKNSKPSQS